MNYDDELSLELSAEEYDRARFSDVHKFSEHDERIIRKLMAHGPVLLQGSRGTGKSALLIAASLRLFPSSRASEVYGLYISLRYVPLLRADGLEYEKLFCTWVSREIGKILESVSQEFPICSDIVDMREALAELNLKSGKRIVLLFDDAAHIGRETSLGAFFDLFRTLSSHTVSCKAAIYPGVTEFGTRFDIYNDATVVDAARSPDRAGFATLFSDILRARYPQITEARVSGIGYARFAELMATAVLGNVRGFIFACNDIVERNGDVSSLGYNALGETFKSMAAGYYWPLLEEVTPKLGKYTSAAEVSISLAELIFQSLGANGYPFALVHKANVMRLSKSLEILEYVGFIVKRQASRAMKSGGRGVLYAVNLCTLLERIPGGRLTASQIDTWLSSNADPFEFHERNEQIKLIPSPVPLDDKDLEVFSMSIATLKVSPAYPYGLTENKISRLSEAGYRTIGELADATDGELLDIDTVGKKSLDRIRAVLGQAIWM
jgi:hypothetical protein